jgi:peptide/nickel transport system ATP-binding protein
MNHVAALKPSETSAPSDSVLAVEHLTVTFPTRRGQIYPVRDVSFAVRRGRTLGVVGESGSGKSVTLRAILGLVPSPGRVVAGSVRYAGRDLVGAPRAELEAIRGREIGTIFQDPMASLNPVLSVGDQLVEIIRAKAGLGRAAAVDRAVELLAHVGIRDPRSRLRAYPHQLSGGIAQRVMIAIAIAANPLLLLADEPTTALDVSVQDQVLELLAALRDEREMAMIIVSHDMGVIARTCDDVAVMYSGRILERGPVEDVLRRPRHPYTRMLLATVPELIPTGTRRRLATIPGQLPDLVGLGEGCPFAERCALRRDECPSLALVLDRPDPAHGSACPFAEVS